MITSYAFIVSHSPRFLWSPFYILGLEQTKRNCNFVEIGKVRVSAFAADESHDGEIRNETGWPSGFRQKEKKKREGREKETYNGGTIPEVIRDAYRIHYYQGWESCFIKVTLGIVIVLFFKK